MATKKSPKKSSGSKPKKTTKATARKAVSKVINKTVNKAGPSAPQVASRMRVYNLTRDIPEHQYFILANGQPVKNVAELAAILDQLEDHVFSHHVNPDKNDFHNWVKDVFEDVELARKLSGIKEKKHMQLVIYRHMAGHD